MKKEEEEEEDRRVVPLKEVRLFEKIDRDLARGEGIVTHLMVNLYAPVPGLSFAGRLLCSNAIRRSS